MLSAKQLLESRRVPHAKPRPKDVMVESRMGRSRQPERRYYRWTPKKVSLLESLAENGMPNKDIAAKLNEQFGGEATVQTVESKLSQDVYKRRPELKRSYGWTPEKVKMLERLVGKGLTNREIAGKLNEQFGGEATARIVVNRLARDVYRRRPELKRIYEWTPGKVKVLERLVGKGLTNKEIAGKLNEMFEGEATDKTVRSKLSFDVYSRRPELKRR